MEQIFELISSSIIDIFKSYFDLAVKHYLDNPWMKIVLAFVPALISIAYPLIVQTISRLDEKYKSPHIVSQFKKEPYHKYFLFSLMLSVILTLLCFAFSFTIFILAFISLCSLLFIFFKYLNILLKYQSSQELFVHLLNQLDFDNYYKIRDNNSLVEKRKKEILSLWNPIIDLYKYSIITKDKKLEDDIKNDFIKKAFNFIIDIEQKDVELVRFPVPFYNSTYDIISVYMNNHDPNYYSNVEMYVGSIFFSRSFEDEKKQFFHEDTLLTIWRNLSLLVEHKRNDKIIRYWENAHQYFDFDLRLPDTKYDDSFKENEESKSLRLKIEGYRNIFLQFHTVLGAYLLYKENYKAIREIWFFTQSQPPRYSLMPLTMNEIFDFYFTFLKEHWQNPKIAIRYWFRDLEFDSMNGKLDVKYYVRKYACLLFLRQWIVESYFGLDPLAFPIIPKEQHTKQLWLKNIDYFENIVQEYLENDLLKKGLGLQDVTIENCAKEKIQYPINYLQKLKIRIIENFEVEINNSDLDEEKKNNLDNYTIKLLTTTYNKFQRISGHDVKKAERDSLSNTMQVIRGTRMLFDKEVFIKNSSISHLNYDKVIAHAINNDYYSHVSLKFHTNSATSYTVPNGQTFKAIDGLKLNSDIHIIIAFVVNIQYYKNYHNIKIEDPLNDEDYRYNNVPIYCFNQCHPLAANSLYVLRKEDRPMIKHIDWSDIPDLPEETQNEWKSRDKIDQSLKLYRKFTELNESVELRDEYKSRGKTEEELKNQLEVEVDFLAYCWFKKGIKMIEIKESDKFQEGGIKNQLSDIKPFGISEEELIQLNVKKYNT